MKAVFKTGLTLLLFLIFYSSHAQNVIVLRDRIIDDTGLVIYPWEKYAQPLLYQAKIIDGFIYTVEFWNHEVNFNSTAQMYLAKYDLNGNMVKRKPFLINTVVPSIDFYNDNLHADYGNFSIYKADSNNLIFYFPAYSLDGDPARGVRECLYKCTNDLDSVKMISRILPINHYRDTSRSSGYAERYLKKSNDNNYFWLTGGNNYRKTIRKIDKNLNTIWSTEIDTVLTTEDHMFNNNLNYFKNSDIEEFDGNIYVFCTHINIPCWDGGGSSNCQNVGRYDVNIFVLNQNGSVIAHDSFNLRDDVNGVEKAVRITNGFRLLTNGYIYPYTLNFQDGMLITDWDSINHTVQHVNAIPNNNYRSLLSNPFLNRGMVETMSLPPNATHVFYQYNSSYSAVYFNPISLRPFPDSFLIYYGNHLMPATFMGNTWIDENIDSTILLLGAVGLADSGLFMSIIPLSDLYYTYQGNVLKDNIKNCSLDPTADQLYKNTIVEVTKTSGTLPYRYYATSDMHGKFDMLLDSGSYKARAIPPNDLWNACPATDAFIVNSQTDTVKRNYYIQRSVLCPKLSVGIVPDRLRSCIQSNYYVYYCNKGTADATGSFIKVEFDSTVSVVSADVPYTQSGNTYTFQTGTIKEDTCGRFSMIVNLACNIPIGTTVCATAHIYPDSVCAVVSALWDHSNVTVSAKCLGDSVKFTIKNSGTGNMSIPKKYYVFENDVMIGTPQNFQLNAGQQLLFKRKANGNTQRIVAEQSDYFPYPSNPTAAIEGCGGLTPGFFNQFPNDDAADFVSISCMVNTGSYDPNEKEGIPTGINAEHLISKGTDIEYKINFQNTGNDTAYDVYILDTISPKLDITTLQMGAASHPYTYEIYGTGILKVVFRNINLVDSFQNEALSHGFFTYRISQDSLTKNNDKILNSAFIYFDSNHPVQTNTTLHTVTENFFSVISSVVENKWKATTTVYPNPFSDKCTIEIKSEQMNKGSYHFTLFDIKGQIIEEQTFENKIEIYGKNLNANLYLFRIEKNGELISNGKIVKQ